MYFRKLWLIYGFLYIALIIALSLSRVPDVNAYISFTDKVIHFLIYFLLVGWFVQLYHRRKIRWLIFSGAILLGMGIEFLQGMTDYRSFDYLDEVANAIGAACALLLARTRFDCLLMHIDNWIYSKL
jgi:glycopeptide antibiotics resistance protein